MNTSFHFKSLSIVILALLTFHSCKSEPNDSKLPVVSEVVTPSSHIKSEFFPYDLEKIENEWKLSSGLKEISGLTYNVENNELLAVNDEKGYLYFIDSKSGEELKRHKFSGGGDYEGVEVVGDQVFVVRSDGTLLNCPWSTESKAASIPTRLSYDNNIEGLGYDSKKNTLLLACKDKSEIEKGPDIKGKAVYEYSLTSRTLNTKPLFSIRDRDICDWFTEHKVDPEKDKSLNNRLRSFSPSGIAVHPVSGHFYMLSAKGNLLVVVDHNGEVVHIELLAHFIEQPEGICFDPKGTMFISSEGVDKKGRIYTFKIRK
jgi:uncharacterized protein YjiK